MLDDSRPASGRFCGNWINESELAKQSLFELPTECHLCPRHCKANRAGGERGVCGADNTLLVARAALHYWEEPPLSGESGSGTVFFSGCPLHCLYCQNATIAASQVGAETTIDRLVVMFLRLQDKNALNINLVTPTHYAPQIRAALVKARQQGLHLPVVWNTSSYETVQAIHDNAGLVDVYLADFKYAQSGLAKRYSAAFDYPQVALAALNAMVEEVGELTFDEYHNQPRLTRGVVVRHLMLPGALEDSKQVVKLVHEHFGDAVVLSLMNQYTPLLYTRAQEGDCFAQKALERCPELANTVSADEYEELLDYADTLGVNEYFWQEGGAATESFIPAFDLTGVCEHEVKQQH